jgi:hypothetical protein
LRGWPSPPRQKQNEGEKGRDRDQKNGGAQQCFKHCLVAHD